MLIYRNTIVQSHKKAEITVEKILILYLCLLLFTCTKYLIVNDVGEN